MNARDVRLLTAALLYRVAEPADESKARHYRCYTLRDLRSKLLAQAANSQLVPSAALMYDMAELAEKAIVQALPEGQILARWLLTAQPAEVTALLEKAADALAGQVSE